MTYREMLYHTVNSKVVLEINQGCVDGFTSRFLESVMYNKRLLTNNFAVQKISITTLLEYNVLSVSMT